VTPPQLQARQRGHLCCRQDKEENLKVFLSKLAAVFSGEIFQPPKDICPVIVSKLDETMFASRSGLRGGNAGNCPWPSAPRGPRDDTYLFQIKYSFEKLSWFNRDTRLQLYITMLLWVSLTIICKFDFRPVVEITTEYKYVWFCSLQIYLNFACNFSYWSLFSHGNIYSCITPTAQMSRKQYYLRA